MGLHQVAHAVFNLFEFGIWQPADLWVEQAAAEWAAFRLENFTYAREGLTSARPTTPATASAATAGLSATTVPAIQAGHSWST